jgi:short-subunit dehydrogenase
MCSEWKGKWALVTGASAGIGTALAQQLAAGGTNLILTARRIDRLEILARRLADHYKTQTEIVVADLAQPSAPEHIFAFTDSRRIEVSLLVNNAGFGQYGELHQVETDRLLEMVQVNCNAVLHLTRLYLPGMVAKRSGDILIVASTASFQAVPYISTYAATKVFDLFLAEGLAEEMKPYGIRVCALCPGTTQSEFHELAGHPAHSKGRQQSAETVAKNGLKALAAGKSYVISGLGNYLGAQGERLVPRRFVTKIAAKLFRPSENGK